MFYFQVTETTEQDKDSKDMATYSQTLKFYPEIADNRKTLRCEVDHIGYTQGQIDSRENRAEVQLDIRCKYDLSLEKYLL